MRRRAPARLRWIWGARLNHHQPLSSVVFERRLVAVTIALTLPTIVAAAAVVSLALATQGDPEALLTAPP